MLPGKFTTPLVTRHLGPQRKLLVERLVYRDRRGRTFVVSPGFVFDGASVPRLLWWLYPPFGEAYEPAACLHDYLYKHAELVRVGRARRPLERREADLLMREASRDACGFRGTGAWVMHQAVRLGGWVAWRRHREAAASIRSVL